MKTPDTPAVIAARRAGLGHRVVAYGPVGDIEEAALKRGIPVGKILKSLVVSLGSGEYSMVLVPGDRVIDWPKLRSLLGVSRMSLATEKDALEMTGYPRGAITPLGSKTRLSVVIDAAATGEVSLGGGAHGLAIHLQVGDLARHLDAVVADVTRSIQPREKG